MRAFWRVHRVAIFIGALSIFAYSLLGYVVERPHTYALTGSFLMAAACWWLLMEREKGNFNFLWITGLVFRVVFMLSLPVLSQDYLRFLWDGQLVNLGLSPYDLTPDQLISDLRGKGSNWQALYEGMGTLSAGNYSNYAPFNQYLFALATWVGRGSILHSVIALRLVIIGADVATVFLLKDLLRKFNISTHHAFWYYLNPLVIVELTGNLHFEGVMIALFALALWLLVKGRIWLASFFYGASIGIKLVPVLFLPLFLTHVKLRKNIAFYAGIFLTLAAALAPFFTEHFVDNYQQTIGLWFSNFRFNAGIFGLVNWIGTRFFELREWVLIRQWGVGLPVATILCALGLLLFRWKRDFVQLTQAMLFLLSFYFLLTPTVHPWYLAFLLFLGVFGTTRFQLVWSIAVILSYAAYRDAEVRERPAMLILEYSLVFITLLYDFVSYQKFKGKFRRKRLPASNKS